jgi:hypothetical protein
MNRRACLAGLTLPLLSCMTALSGCGDDPGGTSKVERSETANKADASGRDAMKEFMQGKTQKKKAR